MLKLPNVGTPIRSFTSSLQIINNCLDVQINFQGCPRYSQAHCTINTDVRWPSVQNLFMQVDYLLKTAGTPANIVFRYDRQRGYIHCIVPTNINPYPNNQTSGSPLQFTSHNYKIK